MSVTFGDYEDHSGDAARLQALRLKLAAVDHAINKLREAGSAAEEQGAETQSLPQLLPPHSPRHPPNSQLIDTTSRQMGCCPKCFVEMPLSFLRGHMARDCSDLMTTCPEVGCLAEFPQTELKRHLAKECRITKHRRQLIQQAQVRKEEKRLAALELAKEAAARTGGSNFSSSNYSMDLEESGSSWGRHTAEEEAEAEPPIPTYTCPQCEDAVLFSKAHTHHEVCRERLVYCPNRPLGCPDEIKLSAMKAHLLGACSVEARKAELIARSNKRKELVRCAGCGDFFPLRSLAFHEAEECPNRKVACRNAHLGCHVVMRAKMLKAHQEVDNAKARIRYCLYLAGGGAHISLQEDDVTPPWTAEYWLYRPSAKEAAKQHIRASLMLVPAFIDAFMIEHHALDSMLAVTAILSDKTKQYTQEEREDTMELLADAVELFEDAAIAAVAAGKVLACSIGAAQQSMTEFMPASMRSFLFPYPDPDNDSSPTGVTTKPPPAPAPGSLAAERVSLRLQPPGEASQDRTKEALPSQSRAKTSAAASREKKARTASASASGPASVPGSAAPPRPDSESAKEGETGEEIGGSAGEGEGNAADNEEGSGNLETGEQEEDAEEKDLEASETEDEEKEEANFEGSSDAVDIAPEEAKEESTPQDDVPVAAPVSEAEAADVAVEPSANLSSSSQRPGTSGAGLRATSSLAPQEQQHQKEQQQQQQRPPSRPKTPQSPWHRPQSAAKVSALSSLLSVPSTFSSFATYAVPAVGTPYTPAQHTAHGRDSSVSFDPATVPAPAMFLLQCLIRGRRGGAGQGVVSSLGFHTTLSWPEWWAVSVLLADALWGDRETLKELELDSGLLGQRKDKDKKSKKAEAEAAAAEAKAKSKGKELSPAEAAEAEAKRAAEEAKRLEEEEEAKKALKKEKARLKKEARMKKGQQLAAAEAEAEAEANAEPSSETKAEDEANEMTDEERREEAEKSRIAEEKRARKEAKEKARAAKKHLRDRLADLERGNSGVDLLGFPSSLPVGSGGSRGGLLDRICLDMVSCPLSWKPLQDAQKPAYLLAQEQKEQERSQKKSAKGGESLSSSGSAVGSSLDKRDNAIAGKMGVVLAECPEGGPGCYSFPASIPREAWVHLALSASPAPNNRLTLYVDGMLKGSLKDCAVPLPMAAISAPSPHGLSAALLDVRLWNRLRSQLEIQMTMSRLITLEPPPAAVAPGAKAKRVSAEERRRLEAEQAAKGKAPPPVRSSTEASSLLNQQPDLTDRGLIAWLPFEDGLGAVRVTDVTEHRFPAALSRNLLPPLMPPPTVPGIAGGPASATSYAKPGSASASSPSKRPGSGSGIVAVARDRVNKSRVAGAAEAPPPAPLDPSSALLSGAGGGDYVVVDALSTTRFADATPPPSRLRPTSHAPSLLAAAAAAGAATEIAGEGPWMGGSAVQWDFAPPLSAQGISAGGRAPTPAPAPSAAAQRKPKVPKLPTYKVTPWIWLDADGLPLPAKPLPEGETDRPLPVPAFSSRGVCPFELRRLRLAQRGRQLYKEVNCPLGCDETVLKKDVRFHVAHECELRCVPCRHAPTCAVEFPVRERRLHERWEADTPCAYIAARMQQLSLVEQRDEVVPCDACGEEMPRRALPRHLRSSCPYRVVNCPHEDCGSLVQHHMLPTHLKLDCPYEQNKAFLVQRARQRSGYARPWALEVDFPPAPSTLLAEDATQEAQEEALKTKEQQQTKAQMQMQTQTLSRTKTNTSEEGNRTRRMAFREDMTDEDF